MNKRSLEPESSASANSAIPAECLPQDVLREGLVGRGGFEPPKSVTADLQSAPFGHSGTYPYAMNRMELAMGLEPATC